MKTLKELEQQRLEDIKKLNEFYYRRKQKLKSLPLSLEKLSFDIITDVRPISGGIRYAKRKAIFLHHLSKYFRVTKKRK